MKKTIIAAAVLVALTACNKSLIETPATEGDFGYITFDVTANAEIVETKSSPNTDSYLVTLKKKTDGSIVNGYENKQFSEITGDIKLSAGDYIVEVQNFKAEDLYTDNRTNGAVRVFGSTEVAVTPGGTHTVPVTCNPVNSKVTVNYDNTESKFTNVFGSPLFSVSNGTKSFNMTVGHEEANAVYYNTSTTTTIGEETVGVAELTWTLTAIVNNKSQTFTGNFNAPAAKWTQINFTAGDSGKVLNITITTDESITEVYTIPVTIDPTTGTESETPEE